MALFAAELSGLRDIHSGTVLFSLVVSCNNWNLQRTMSFLWIGFENYSELMRDQLGAVKG